MQKKLNRKLALSKETLRNLSLREIYEAKGGQTNDSVCSSDTCLSCETECACSEPTRLCTRPATGC